MERFNDMANGTEPVVRRCADDVTTYVHHVFRLFPCCPFSGNPKEGSLARLSYCPNGVVMPVEDLEAMAREYIGGLGQIRGMEEMVQDMAKRISDVCRVRVRLRADLVISPPFGGADQTMRVSALAAAMRVK